MGTTGSKKRNEENLEQNQKKNNLTSNNDNVEEEVISDEGVQQQQQIIRNKNNNSQQHEGEEEREVEAEAEERPQNRRQQSVTVKAAKDLQTKTITNTKAITKTTTAESPAAFATSPKAISSGRKSTSLLKSTSTTTTSSQSQSQRLKQNSSTWSLNSLLGSRLNWSFSGSSRHSVQRQRNKSTRKSFSNLQTHQPSLHHYQHHNQQLQQQQQQKRSKTTWHKPITNAIFSSHFKESSHSIEKYQIKQLVAKGAFGIVFKVIDKKQQQNHQQQQQQQQQPENKQGSPLAKSSSLAKDSSSSAANNEEPKFYALKVLKKSKIISDNSVQQIKDEADIQKLCGHHPFLVQQLDLWQTRHNLLILSEYIPNGELFSKITNFSIELVRLYLAEIALAIDFLHNAGIIYRDAKPENILLTDKYHIKLTDFGLSKWLKLGMTTKTLCGTFQYMAPEILRGEPYGHAVDWWSLGVIVSQMLLKKGPDIRQFLQINLPSHIADASSTQDTTDNTRLSCLQDFTPSQLESLIAPLGEKRKESLNNISDFLPPEIENLCHEGKDVIKRLLVVDPKQRLHSVLGLQRIALYKNFKVETNHLLSISPLELLKKDQTFLMQNEQTEEDSVDLGALDLKYLQNF